MATLQVLSAGAVKEGVARLAGEFQRQTGSEVKIEFATAPKVRERVLAGEAVDVVIATPAAMDELEKRGKIVSGSRATIGRSRVAVVVRKGIAPPDMASAAAFKQALLGADALVSNQASSGIYVEKLLEKLGIVTEMQPKIVRVANGAAVMRRIAEGTARREIGVGQLSEILNQISKGTAVTLVGTLPDEIQNYTMYIAAMAAGGAARESARSLIRQLTGPAAKSVFAATGID